MRLPTTVTEGVSDTNPFGQFEMNFKGVGTDNNNNEFTLMEGTLQTVDNESAGPQFQFYLESSDALQTELGETFKDQVNVRLDDADGNGGQAHLAYYFHDSDDNWTEEGGYRVAFDETRFLRESTVDDTDQVCTARDEFTTQVWRYNLYHAADRTYDGRDVAAGERVRLTSGFPFTYEAGDDRKYGHVGYWGVWLDDASVELLSLDGATITRRDDTEYTLHVAPGVLERREKETLGLTSLDGEEFFYWGESPDGGKYPDEEGYDDWVVRYTDVDGFEIVAGSVWGDHGPERTDLESPQAFELNDNDRLWLWSDSLGGDVVYTEGEQEVVFYAHEIVQKGGAVGNKDSGEVTLYCYEGCLKGGLTQEDINNATGYSDLEYEYWDGEGAPQGPFEYTMDLDGMELKDHHDEVVDLIDANGEPLDLSGTDFEWGLGTSEMVLEKLADPDEPWRVYEQDETYRWFTGTEHWDLLAYVTEQGTGEVESFDKPLSFRYEHSAGNDRNDDDAYYGRTMLLEYGGRGDLWGFPWREDEETGRWYSAVTLRDGTILTRDNLDFVVKAIEMEQKMLEQEDGCSAITLPSAADLPLPTETDVGTVSITLADKPEVTDAPAVIEGELQ